MNGKGSGRRPAAIDRETEAARWAATFGKREPVQTPEDVAAWEQASRPWKNEYLPECFWREGPAR